MNRGMVFTILAVFAGYTIGSYGVVLLKGWAIPWREWVNPVNPYQWPSGDVPAAEPTRILPK